MSKLPDTDKKLHQVLAWFSQTCIYKACCCEICVGVVVYLKLQGKFEDPVL